MNQSVIGAAVFKVRGQVYDLPDAEAKQYIDAKLASREAVTAFDKRETPSRKARESR